MLASFVQSKANELLTSNTAVEGLERVSEQQNSSLPNFINFDSPLGQFVEPYFAVFGREVRTSTEDFQASWVRLAMGSGGLERVFAITVGYAMIALALAIYMNVLTAGTVKSAGKVVRTAVRQQLLVVKVGFT